MANDDTSRRLIRVDESANAADTTPDVIQNEWVLPNIFERPKDSTTENKQSFIGLSHQHSAITSLPAVSEETPFHIPYLSYLSAFFDCPGLTSN